MALWMNLQLWKMTLNSSYNKYKNFKPPFPFTNAFLATLLSKLRIRLHKKVVKKVTKNTIKEIFTCRNGIRLSVHKNLQTESNKTIFLIPGYLSHQDTSYMQSSLVYFYNHGWNVIRINPVDHGDTLPLNKEIFNALQHTLVAECIENYLNDRHTNALMGFSFGGNYAIRIGTLEIAKKIKQIIAICPMVDHEKSIAAMQSPFFKWYYKRKWQKSFKYKEDKWPEYDFSELYQIKDFRAITAKLLPSMLPEFTNIDDYFAAYKITNNVVDELQARTTIIASKDDEVVPSTTFQHLAENDNFRILFTEYGGHNGFIENYKFEDFSIKIAFEEAIS